MTPRALPCRRRREAYGSASGPVRVPPPLPPDFLGVDAEAAAEARLAEAKGGQYNARSAWLASSKLSLTRGCVKEGVQGEAFEQWVGGEQSPEPAPTATRRRRASSCSCPRSSARTYCHNLLCNNNFVGFLTRDVASEDIILCAKTRS